jgi:hypothetical protein
METETKKTLNESDLATSQARRIGISTGSGKCCSPMG